jgi:hypothetical protein
MSLQVFLPVRFAAQKPHFWGSEWFCFLPVRILHQKLVPLKNTMDPPVPKTLQKTVRNRFEKVFNMADKQAWQLRSSESNFFGSQSFEVQPPS